eukprot:TRINITY_DN1717_c6_g1_i1.p2 TRINITY_DN1717_c6_g1~~TRINITY_DN1717_c6_g1_i1.p2  ORF type:complete len:130 (-),score=9.83 TRINITY_DN1717_c6_g1_i1:112-501(-)
MFDQTKKNEKKKKDAAKLIFQSFFGKFLLKYSQKFGKNIQNQSQKQNISKNHKNLNTKKFPVLLRYINTLLETQILYLDINDQNEQVRYLQRSQQISKYFQKQQLIDQSQKTFQQNFLLFLQKFFLSRK